MNARLAASSAPRSAGCVPMRWPEIVRSPSRPASYARTSATGVLNNATRTIWITVNAAPRRVAVVPMLAARWQANKSKLKGRGLTISRIYAEPGPCCLVSAALERCFSKPDSYRPMNNPDKTGEKIMTQTMVQINEAISIHNDAGIVRTNLPDTTTSISAVAPKGHEGHVMPMPPKAPAVKPANEKVKPKVPSKPPAAKPPAKQAKSCMRAEPGRAGNWYVPPANLCRGPTLPRV